jgi:hypothetical protein
VPPRFFSDFQLASCWAKAYFFVITLLFLRHLLTRCTLKSYITVVASNAVDIPIASPPSNPLLHSLAVLFYSQHHTQTDYLTSHLSMIILPLKGVVWFGKMLKVSLLAVSVTPCSLLQGPWIIAGETLFGCLVEDLLS